MFPLPSPETIADHIGAGGDAVKRECGLVAGVKISQPPPPHVRRASWKCGDPVPLSSDMYIVLLRYSGGGTCSCGQVNSNSTSREGLSSGHHEVRGRYISTPRNRPLTRGALRLFFFLSFWFCCQQRPQLAKNGVSIFFLPFSLSR